MPMKRLNVWDWIYIPPPPIPWTYKPFLEPGRIVVLTDAFWCNRLFSIRAWGDLT